MKPRFQKWLATGFGLGYSPFAPGTAGTLLALPIVLLMHRADIEWQVLAVFVMTVLAIPICSAGERLLGGKDDGRIVADEYLTFPICTLGLPVSVGTLLLAFITCRCFDIFKPPPARRMECLQGGFGVVMDDVVAAFYSLAVNHLILRLVWPHLAPWFSPVI